VKAWAAGGALAATGTFARLVGADTMDGAAAKTARDERFWAGAASGASATDVVADARTAPSLPVGWSSTGSPERRP
jgi:hypothetical protein